MKFNDLFDDQEALRFKRKLKFKQQTGLIPDFPIGLTAWLPVNSKLRNQMKFKPILFEETWLTYIKKTFYLRYDNNDQKSY